MYKREYLRRLEERIHSRKLALESGQAQPEDYLVPGVRPFIDLLQKHGVRCYLASGTDEAGVLYEAHLLGLGGAATGAGVCAMRLLDERGEPYALSLIHIFPLVLKR